LGKLLARMSLCHQPV